MGATTYSNEKFEKEFTNDENLWNNIQAYKEHLQKQYVNSTITYSKKKGTTYTYDNPIENFNPKDVFTLLIKTPQYYIRFGALLDYLVDKIIPSIKTTSDLIPIFEIDTAQYFNWMYSVPNQVSLDPRVCLVRNSKFIGVGGGLDIYGQLPPFRAEDYVTVDPNLNKAYIMNIYLNFNFIIDSLSSNTDERGDIGVYNFILAICDGLNKALGGVNNLEPVIDENSNTLKIIDTTPIPGVTKEDSSSYRLQLYGYDNKFKDGVKTSSKSNFIRKIDLKTAITPEYATMITVGATAGGYVKGTEATAFSRWNLGLTDRFKEEIVPSNPNSRKKNPSDPNEPDEAETNYVEKFLKSYTGKHGFNGNMYQAGTLLKLDISSDAIDRNISVVTEYYKFLQSQNKEGGGGTIGFIPFKLGLTMDGLSGIKIYNKLHVNTRFLPSNYGKTLDLIVTGVSHDLSNHDWETQIEATVIPKTTQSKATAITIEDIQETIINVNLSANTPKPDRWPYYSINDSVPPDIEAPSKGTAPNYNIKVSYSSAIKTDYFPILKTIPGKTKGIKLLALAMTQKEGFTKNSRSYTTNNPGNVGNTDSGANNTFSTLEQFIKIYATGARGGNSYLSLIISVFRKNGFTNVTEKTTLIELIKLNNSTSIIL